MSRRPKMFLMCGISGAGKTTFAKRFAKEHDILYLGVDDFYRVINGDECKHENFFDVWISFYRAIHIAEIHGYDVVVDTNAVERGHRDQFLQWFPSFEHHLIYMNTPFEVCKKQNLQRRRQVPEEAMNSQHRKLDIPSLENEPGWVDMLVVCYNTRLDNPDLVYIVRSGSCE